MPVLRCAICEKPIMLAADAAMVYPRGIEPGELKAVILVHQGSNCLKRAQANQSNELGNGLVMDATAYGDRLRRTLTAGDV